MLSYSYETTRQQPGVVISHQERISRRRRRRSVELPMPALGRVVLPHTSKIKRSCRLWRKMANIAFVHKGKILRHSCLCA